MYDSLSSVLISGQKGQCNRTVYFTKWVRLNSFFVNACKNFLRFDLEKPKISQILLQLNDIGNRTSCHLIRSVIILVIKQIRLPLRGCLVLFIICFVHHSFTTTDWMGLHSVLLPLFIIVKWPLFTNKISHDQKYTLDVRVCTKNTSPR